MPILPQNPTELAARAIRTGRRRGADDLHLAGLALRHALDSGRSDRRIAQLVAVTQKRLQEVAP